MSGEEKKGSPQFAVGLDSVGLEAASEEPGSSLEAYGAQRRRLSRWNVSAANDPQAEV